MITRTKDGFLRASGIGQQWRVSFRRAPAGYDAQRDITVKLEGLTPETFSCELPNGEKLDTPLDNIYWAEMPEESLDLTNPRTPCMEWYSEKKSFLSKEELSLIRVFRKAFDIMAADKDCPGGVRGLSGVLAASRIRDLKNQLFANEEELRERIESLKSLRAWREASFQEQSAAVALLRLVGGDYVSALNSLISEAVEARNDAVLLPLACFFRDIRENPACLYWLRKHFDSLLAQSKSFLAGSETDWGQKWFVWWHYLRLSVAFDYYPDVERQILSFLSLEPTFALESMAFLFCERRDRYKAELAYDLACNHPELVTPETLRSLFASLDYNVTLQEWNTYFYRYRLLSDQILNETLYCPYQENEDLRGLIYDYVNSRNYCLILGYDLIPYFMYFDDGTRKGDNASKRILERLKREFNILTPIVKETPVRLIFDRVPEIDTVRRRIAIRNAKIP